MIRDGSVRRPHFSARILEWLLAAAPAHRPAAGTAIY